jgi:hypothetical protein
MPASKAHVAYSIDEAWSGLVSDAVYHGELVKPRGLPNREVRHVDVSFPEPVLPVMLNEVRRANPVMGIVELMYFLNGRDDDSLADNWLQGMNAYVNPETYKFDGGYGPSLYAGLPYIFSVLNNDHDTRRAVLSFLNQGHTRTVNVTKDYPCNTQIGWNIRGGRLNCWMTTRSQDLYRGYIYDQVEFHLLNRMMAKALSLEPGSVDHHIVSSHVYEADVDAAMKAVDFVPSARWLPLSFPFDSVKSFWKYCRSWNGIIDQYDMARVGCGDLMAAPIDYWNRKNIAWDAYEPRGLMTSWLKAWKLNKGTAA